MHRILLLLTFLTSCAPVPAPAAPEYPVARLHLKGDADAEGHNILNLPTDAFALSNGLATAAALSAESAARQSGDAATLASATNYTDAAVAAIVIPDPDLSAYATTGYVAEAIAAIPAPEPPDLSPYATTSYVAAAVAAIPAPEPPDLSPYATTSHVALAVQTAGSNLVARAGDTMTGPLLFDSPGSTVLSGDLSGSLPFDLMAEGSTGQPASLSGSIYAYGYDYAREESIELAVAPSNLVCTYREAGSATYSCDWLDASTDAPVGSGGYLSIYAYDYGGGYVEVSLYGGASLPDGYLECYGYVSIDSRTPGLSGRAATTDELGAVRSVADNAAAQAADAYSAVSNRATMAQVNSAIASHNSDASAHASAIQSGASSAVGAHNASLDAHSFAHRMVYVGGVNRYIAGSSSDSITGTPCDYIVETTEDAPDFTQHGGVFNLEIGSLKPANVADGLRRFANVAVLVTGVVPDDPSASPPRRNYRPLIRTVTLNDVMVFDCGSCATPIRAVMLRVAVFPGSDPQCLQVLDVKCITPAANGSSEAVANAGKLFIGAVGWPSSEFRFKLVASASSSTAFDPVDITIPGLWVGYSGSYTPSSGLDRIPTFVVSTSGSDARPYLFGSRTTVMVCRTGAGMSEVIFKYGSNTTTIPLPAFPSGATRDWFRFDVCVENSNRCVVTAYTSSTANNYYTPL